MLRSSSFVFSLLSEVILSEWKFILVGFPLMLTMPVECYFWSGKAWEDSEEEYELFFFLAAETVIVPVCLRSVQVHWKCTYNQNGWIQSFLVATVLNSFFHQLFVSDFYLYIWEVARDQLPPIDSLFSVCSDCLQDPNPGLPQGWQKQNGLSYHCCLLGSALAWSQCQESKAKEELVIVQFLYIDGHGLFPVQRKIEICWN